MGLVKNQDIELKIETISSEGSGVGHYDGQVVFVYNTAPGDFIKAHIIKVKKAYAIATIKEIIVPSKDRIEVDCPYFRSCGGCAYRHISYDAERAIKKQNVCDALKRIGNIDAVVDDVRFVATERYRNKTQIPVGRTNTGIVCGFYASHTHRIIPMSDCLLQPKEFSNIVDEIKQWMEDYEVRAYDGEDGLLRHVFLREAFATGEIMVCLVATSDNLPHIEELISRIKVMNGVVGIVININKEKTNVILGCETKTMWGKDTIDDILCGIKISISPSSFYQVNHDTAELLYECVRECCNLTGSETLVDLYCGTGTIGLYLAKYCKKIIGVEIVKEAIENARQNALTNGIENSEFYCGDAHELVKRLKRDSLKADVVIIDPPRKGCSKEIVDDIVEISPAKVVYVSCNVSTQSRDCKALEEKGYIVQKVTPIDMFPRTVHVETVVLMTRTDARKG